MLRILYKCMFVSVLSLCFSMSWAQQKTERDYMRSGNRLYRDSMYTKAEVDYRKAIEENPRFSRVHYNLGHSLLNQQKPKEAMEAYENALKCETNKGRQASIYHNMGVILQSQKQFAEAIDCYKNALRRNPNDNESRYNLVLCQHQLKESPQQQNQQQQKNDENKEQEKQDKQEDKKNQQQQKQQNQQQQNQMSKENAEQLLNAAMQNEKATQEKLKKAMAKPQRRRLEKQW